MSGAHRIVKTRTRPALWKPLRFVWAATTAVGEWCALRAGDFLTWLGERSDRRVDDFWDDTEPVTPPEQTTPPEVLVYTPEPEPLSLTPDDALHALHAEHPNLPGQCLTWRIGDNTVLGEVNALDRTPVQQRSDVYAYGLALNAGAADRETGDGHIILSTVGEYAGVTFVVSAVLLADDTVPLLVYAEAAGDESLTDTLTTQVIPERVLAEVLSK